MSELYYLFWFTILGVPYLLVGCGVASAQIFWKPLPLQKVVRFLFWPFLLGVKIGKKS
jgi:hypothetical protein